MTSTTTAYNFLRLEACGNSGAVRLIIDCPGKTNVLSSAVMEELGNAFSVVAGDAQVKAVILLSGKPDMFAAGADLQEILSFENSDQAYKMVKRGQEVFARLVNLGKPVVAGIHGMCLGGGLELALCANRRIATADGATRLGLPEAGLGLVPGLGGTQRLPRLIGLKPALDLIMSGKPVPAQEACRLGLVDEVVEPADLHRRLEEAALELIACSEPINIDEAPREVLDADKHKSVLAAQERAVRIRTRGNYPAYGKVIEVMREGITNGLQSGLDAEAKAFSELAVSETAHNLVHLFFAQELAVRSGKKNQQPKTNLPEVGIVGAGMMGSSIAFLSASTGHRTHMVETDANRLTAAMETIRKRLPPAIVHPAAALTELNQSQAVIEAITEDLETKIKLFQQLEQVVPADCLLASNTSCLSITEIAKALTHGERLVGMHFFHPVERMPLVEIIVHPSADRQFVQQAVALAAKLGKVPVLVNDSPGFLVNRILCPYLIESALIAEEGVPLSWIEEAAIAFGMPMGPFALMDEISLDISFKVAKLLHDNFGARLALPELLHKMETLGLLGKKNGRGFYSYDDSGSRKSFNEQLVEFAGLALSDEKLPAARVCELQDRLILPMVREAQRCLTEKIVRKQWQIDLAMVLGTGFPAFRGGPLRYASISLLS